MKKLFILLLILSFGIASGIQSASIPRNGLIAYYDFSNSTKDKSENGHDLTVADSPAIFTSDSNGSPSKALRCDGSNDYFVIDNSNEDFNFVSQNNTVAFWLKAAGSTYSYAFAQDKGFTVGVYDTTGELEVTFTNAAGSTTSSFDMSGIANNTWHHLALVWGAVSNKNYVYLDGVYEGYVNATGAYDCSNNIYIGKYHTGSNYMNCSIDELVFYDHAMNATEVANLRNCGLASGKFEASSEVGVMSLVASSVNDYIFFAPLHEPDVNGTLVQDKSPEHNNGSASNCTIGDDYTEFNGSTSYMDFGDDPFGDLTGDLSISCYIYMEDNGELPIFSNGTLYFYHEYDRIRITGNGSNIAYSDDGFDNDTWYHVVAVRPSVGTTGVKFYINGADMSGAPNSGTPAVGSTNTFVGKNGSDYFDGYIKNLRVYDRLLTQDEAIYLKWIDR